MYLIHILDVLLLASVISATKRFWTQKQDNDLAEDQPAFLELADCPFQIEPVGCFKDKKDDRALPDEIWNGRDPTRDQHTKFLAQIQWTNYNHWLANFICYGAQKLFEKKPDIKTDYIGVQYYGEIWANIGNEKTTHDKHGKAMTCCDGDYKDVTSEEPNQCGLFAGKSVTNYVYKVTNYKSVEKIDNCPYFQSKGCWADKEPWHKDIEKRPMEVYAMNERDPYANNWNKRMIDWGKWGKGYLGDLLCRCADLAKKSNKKFFSIQFYGECWITNVEPRFKEDGASTQCVDGEWGVCDMNNGMEKKCRNHFCAGKAEANKVYQLMQGPHMCQSSPCKNKGKCLTVGTNDFVCQCKAGYSGEDCGIETPKDAPPH